LKQAHEKDGREAVPMTWLLGFSRYLMLAGFVLFLLLLIQLIRRDMD
jgi:hypothetical protein